MNEDPYSHIEILLIESNEGDLILITETLSNGRLINKINVVKDTAEALKYLHKEEQFKEVKCPDILLINLSLAPITEAKEINKILEIPHCQNLQTIILTNDDVEEDILRSSGIEYPFLRRPFKVEDLIKILTEYGKFYVSIEKKTGTQ